MAQFDRERAEKKLKEILDKMQGDTDVVLLREYHKLYKNNISLFKRSWAAAWLLMNYDLKETCPAPDNNRNIIQQESKIEKIEKPDRFADADAALPEDESKRLFFSIGKNRRLYPRELAAFITSKTSALKEDIGIIRILDNYSFVQVRDTKADEIIETLNSTRFRGRTLTVNFAKMKNSEELADNK
ncbi:MAG: DbpA RNA binding domain-containing protein [Treponema sp.]|nr:DbpA RNA binding domain-containing protein [Treponema sp.]